MERRYASGQKILLKLRATSCSLLGITSWRTSDGLETFPFNFDFWWGILECVFLIFSGTDLSSGVRFMDGFCEGEKSQILPK